MAGKNDKDATPVDAMPTAAVKITPEVEEVKTNVTAQVVANTSDDELLAALRAVTSTYTERTPRIFAEIKAKIDEQFGGKQNKEFVDNYIASLA